MTHAPYTLTGPIGTKATLGLIVLQVDETIEQDFRRLFRDPAIALYVSRIPSGADLTPETIATMKTTCPMRRPCCHLPHRLMLWAMHAHQAQH